MLTILHNGSILNALQKTLLLLICITLCNNSLSLPHDKEQAIEILADSAERDEKVGITVYSGNVDIKQGSLHIIADEVTIKTSRQNASKTSELEKLTAKGSPAHFRQQLEAEGDFVEADANTIHYTIVNRIVQLHEHARLSQGGSIITGNRILYDIAAQRVQARAELNGDSNAERVKVIIPPKKTNEKSSSTAYQEPIKTDEYPITTTLPKEQPSIEPPITIPPPTGEQP